MNDLLSRRRFLADVGKGTVMATIGPALASELGLAPPAYALESPTDLSFGDIEPLVRFMQETQVDKLQAGLVGHLKSGVPLRRLVAAGVLANARTFGGGDYVGFHTFMALSPALKMSAVMPENQQALPVFKVLYRNTNRIQEHGGCKSEVLHAVAPGAHEQAVTGEKLLETVKRRDREGAERQLEGLCRKDVALAFDALLYAVQESTEVHRTVLPYRAWDMIDVVGRENAGALLRQSLRYCIDAESRRSEEWEKHGNVLTRLLDEHKLLGREPGSRAAEDKFVEELSRTIFEGAPEEAAGAAAAALAEGYDPAVVGEALSLATNQLVLRDHGRIPAWEAPGKPPGSVHGDSIGVHASDSANAWRNMARASHGRNIYACLILGAWQASLDRSYRGDEFLEWDTIPTNRQIRDAKSTDREKLMTELDLAIRHNLQARASAIVHRCEELEIPAETVFKTLLAFAVSEDGALHAEKYFQTVWDDFHITRPAYRWRHLIGLARVTASEYGTPAPGQAEARELLNL